MTQTFTVRDFLRSGAAAFACVPARCLLRGSDQDQKQIHQLQIAGSEIEIKFDPSAFDLPAERLLKWVGNAACAVVAYYGVFPVPHMRIQIESSEKRTGIFHGTTWGYTPPLTRIFVGRRTTQEQLDTDWMMTHELVHTAFPDVSDDHHWIEEGIATYVEPMPVYRPAN